MATLTRAPKEGRKMKQVICDNADECDFAGCQHRVPHETIWMECKQAECFRAEHPVKCIPIKSVVTSVKRKKKG